MNESLTKRLGKRTPNAQQNCDQALVGKAALILESGFLQGYVLTARPLASKNPERLAVKYNMDFPMKAMQMKPKRNGASLPRRMRRCSTLT